MKKGQRTGLRIEFHYLLNTCPSLSQLGLSFGVWKSLRHIQRTKRAWVPISVPCSAQVLVAVPTAVHLAIRKRTETGNSFLGLWGLRATI
jgi:hypothetical protein